MPSSLSHSRVRSLHMHLELTESFNVPREKLFDALAHEMIDHLSYVVSNKVVRTEGNLVYREVTQRSRGGRTLKNTAKDELTPPSRMVTTVEFEDGTRGTFVYALEPLPDGGTKLVMTLDGKLSGTARLISPLIRRRLLSLYRKEGDSFRKYVEEKYGS